MHRALFSLLILPVLMMFTTPVFAEASGLKLAHSNNCLACHQVDKKRVGPAFTAIAQRFAGIENNTEILVNSIIKGSRAKWGAVPMPAQPRVRPGDASLIAEWILSLADNKE